jgi:hypothetical protein
MKPKKLKKICKDIGFHKSDIEEAWYYTSIKIPTKWLDDYNTYSTDIAKALGVPDKRLYDFCNNMTEAKFKNFIDNKIKQLRLNMLQEP